MRPDDIVGERSRVVLEAMSWQRTPFGHRQRVKGLEVDCAGFIAEVYERAGVIDHVDLPEYARDWFAHEGNERLYVEHLERWFEPLTENEKPGPGDIAAYRWGRAEVAHAAVVVAWPSVIYASSWSSGNRNVQLGEGDRGPMGHRLSGLWTVRRWTRG